MDIDVAALIDTLKRADEQARSEVSPSEGDPRTIFYWSADDLQIRGAPIGAWPLCYHLDPDDLWNRAAPAGAWPAWDIFGLVAALLALPTRREHSALIIHLAKLCTINGSLAGHIGAMLTDYASPEDTWIVELIKRSMAKDRAPLVSAGNAIRALGFVGGPSTAELLLPLAAKTSNPMACDAALALAQCGIREVEPLILAQLAKKPRPETVEAAGLLGCEEALPVILALATPDSIRRRRHVDAPWVNVISKALVRISPEAAVDALGRLLRELDENYEDSNVIATELARAGDPSGETYLIDKMNGWTGPVRYGTEPTEAKWEAANLLAQRGIELGTALSRSWYRQNTDSGFPRSPGFRYRYLQGLGQAGDTSHLDFLSWVEKTDYEASEKGWALAVEARRAISRINWRKEQLARA